jgi:hypothetical protein
MDTDGSEGLVSGMSRKQHQGEEDGRRPDVGHHRVPLRSAARLLAPSLIDEHEHE